MPSQPYGWISEKFFAKGFTSDFDPGEKDSTQIQNDLLYIRLLKVLLVGRLIRSYLT